MILGVYGLFAKPSRNNITTYIQKLTSLGVESKEFRYSIFLVAHTYLLNRIWDTVKNLYDTLEDGDSIVAHSFGCALVVQMLQELSQYKAPKKLNNIYLFNPAVNGDIKINSSHFNKMYIFYEPRDKMLNLAKLLPFSMLGDLGKYGYQYKNNKIKNIRIDKLDKENMMMHDNAMLEPNLTKYSQFIRECEEKKSIPTALTVK